VPGRAGPAHWHEPHEVAAQTVVATDGAARAGPSCAHARRTALLRHPRGVIADSAGRRPHHAPLLTTFPGGGPEPPWRFPTLPLRLHSVTSEAVHCMYDGAEAARTRRWHDIRAPAACAACLAHQQRQQLRDASRLARSFGERRRAVGVRRRCVRSCYELGAGGGARQQHSASTCGTA
jgi:hypothetical protein